MIKVKCNFKSDSQIHSQNINLKELKKSSLQFFFSRYGSIKVNDEERLTGPGTNFDTYQDEAEEDEGLWSRRYLV